MVYTFDKMRYFLLCSIHKPPLSSGFAPIKHALAIAAEPFKFLPASPLAYELS